MQLMPFLADVLGAKFNCKVSTAFPAVTLEAFLENWTEKFTLLLGLFHEEKKRVVDFAQTI